ncbi:hypothetical protein LINPERPRIM_LOCUS40056 [Linum perenne]
MTSSSATARKTLSKIACNRLQKELVEWQVSPPTGFNHRVTDNLQRFRLILFSAFDFDISSQNFSYDNLNLFIRCWGFF